MTQKNEQANLLIQTTEVEGDVVEVDHVGLLLTQLLLTQQQSINNDTLVITTDGGELVPTHIGVDQPTPALPGEVLDPTIIEGTWSEPSQELAWLVSVGFSVDGTTFDQMLSEEVKVLTRPLFPRDGVGNSTLREAMSTVMADLTQEYDPQSSEYEQQVLKRRNDHAWNVMTEKGLDLDLETPRRQGVQWALDQFDGGREAYMEAGVATYDAVGMISDTDKLALVRQLRRATWGVLAAKDWGVTRKVRGREVMVGEHEAKMAAEVAWQLDAIEDTLVDRLEAAGEKLERGWRFGDVLKDKRVAVALSATALLLVSCGPINVIANEDPGSDTQPVATEVVEIEEQEQANELASEPTALPDQEQDSTPTPDVVGDNGMEEPGEPLTDHTRFKLDEGGLVQQTSEAIQDFLDAGDAEDANDLKEMMASLVITLLRQYSEYFSNLFGEDVTYEEAYNHVISGEGDFYFDFILNQGEVGSGTWAVMIFQKSTNGVLQPVSNDGFEYPQMMPVGAELGEYRLDLLQSSSPDAVPQLIGDESLENTFGFFSDGQLIDWQRVGHGLVTIESGQSEEVGDPAEESSLPDLETLPNPPAFEGIFEEVTVSITSEGVIRAQGELLFMDYDVERQEWRLGEQVITISVPEGNIDSIIQRKPASYYGSDSYSYNNYFYTAEFTNNDLVSVQFAIDISGQTMMNLAVMRKIDGETKILKLAPQQLVHYENFGEGITMQVFNPIDVESGWYRSGQASVLDNRTPIVGQEALLTTISLVYEELSTGSGLHPVSVSFGSKIKGTGLEVCPNPGDNPFYYPGELCRRVIGGGVEDEKAEYQTSNALRIEAENWMRSNAIVMSGELRKDPGLIWSSDIPYMNSSWYMITSIPWQN